MNSKKLLNLPVTLLTLTIASLALVSGCRGTAQLIPESVIVRDTVIVTKERTLTDTLTILKDTVLYQDRVKLEVKYKDSLVFVQATCPPDTVTVETIKVVTSKPEKQQSKFDKFVDNLSVLLLITFLLYIVYWIVRLLK
jgi:hypothetical protein